MNEHHPTERRPHQIWHAPRSGPANGPRYSIEQFLDWSYPASIWLRAHPRFMTWAQYRKRIDHKSMPTLRRYHEYGAIPWPMPPSDHLVFIVDGTTHQLCWASPALCTVLGQEHDKLKGQDAWATLHPGLDIPATAPQYADLWYGIQREPFEQPRTNLKRKTPRIARQVQIDTRIRRHDEIWLAVRMTVSYGSVFQTWFADAEVTAELDDAESSGDSIFNVDQTRIFRAMPPLILADIRTIDDLLRAPQPVQLEYYDEILKRFPYRYRGDDSSAS